MAAQNLSISNFKRFSLKIIIPLVLSVIILGFIFQYLFERGVILNSEINGCYKINRIIKITNNEEVPIFGSSRAQGGFIPSILGSNYFNYGLDGTQDNVIFFFLNEELKKNKNTAIIINFDIDGLNNGTGDIAYYIYNAEYVPVKKLLGENCKYYFHLPFFKYYGYYEYYLKNWLANRISLTKKTDNGSSLELNKLNPRKFNELVNQRVSTIEIFKNDKFLEHTFFDILNNHKNRRFIIVVSPYHKSCFTNFKNFNDAKMYLNDIAKLSNVSVFDFSHVDYPDSLFMNTTHLNYYGAKRFTNELKDSISKIK